MNPRYGNQFWSIFDGFIEAENLKIQSEGEELFIGIRYVDENAVLAMIFIDISDTT